MLYFYLYESYIIDFIYSFFNVINVFMQYSSLLDTNTSPETSFQNLKLLTVKKTGPNKCRKFYACCLPRQEQCNHFQWVDDTQEVSLSVKYIFYIVFLIKILT